MTDCCFVDVENKVWGGRDEGPGDGCLDLGPVLPKWPTAKTCTYILFFVATGT